MRFDGRLEPVDPDARGLDRLDGFQERGLVNDRLDLVVVGHPALELVGQVLDRPLADTVDIGAGRVQAADELTLVVGKRRLDEYDVHCKLLS